MDVANSDFSTHQDFNFIGEGNEHIVLSTKDDECVLRLRKFSPEEKISREELMLRVKDDVYFNNRVALPLAGSLMVEESRIASLDPLVLNSVMEKIKSLRDEKRFCKSVNEYGICIMTSNVAKVFTAREVSEFMEFPKILNFSLKEKVVTVSSSCRFMPFCKLPVVMKNLLDETKCMEGSPLKNVPAHDSSQGTESKEESQIKCSESVESPPVPDESRVIQDKLTSNDKVKTQDVSNKVEDTQNSESQNKQSQEKQVPDDKNIKTVCIELKTKQGYLERGPKGNLFCRFCLKQYFKIETKTEQRRSFYCPQDLFSGDVSRMTKSIENLFSCPQNNLKIFLNGKRIKELDVFRNLPKLMIRILTYPGKICCNDLSTVSDVKESSSPSEDTSEETRCAESGVNTQSSPLISDGARYVPLLPQSTSLPVPSFLSQVLYLQSFGQLCEIDAAYLYKELQKRILTEEAVNKMLTEFSWCESYASEKRISSSTDPRDNASIFKFEDENSRKNFYVKTNDMFEGEVEGLETRSICQLLQECLVSMSAKDASFMLLIQGPYDKNEANVYSDESNMKTMTSPFWIDIAEGETIEWFKCQVSLVDLALKSPKKILEHEVALGNMEDLLIDLRSRGMEPRCCRKQ